MPSLSKIEIIGRFGAAPEMRTVGASQSPVSLFSVAVTERWKDRETQERAERTEWFRVEVWDALAKIVSQYGRQGGLVYVEGSPRTEWFTDAAGVDRQVTKIRASTVLLLDREERPGGAVALNHVRLIGNLGADPEARNAGNSVVASFSVATTERRQDRGERFEHTEWHRIECWNGLADIVVQYGSKGAPVFLEGSMRFDKFTDTDGIDRTVAKIRAHRVSFLDRAPQADDAARDDHKDHDQQPGAQQDVGQSHANDSLHHAGGSAEASAAATPWINDVLVGSASDFPTPPVSMLTSPTPRRPYGQQRDTA